MTINAYPLTWPDGWKRTESYRREHGRFGTRARHNLNMLQDLTISDGVERVLTELAAMGITRDDLVISTNVPVRLDGLPRSDAKQPDDPGVSVWWVTRSGKRMAMAIDRYHRVADNLAAIAATLNAMRAIERHGGAAILERAFTGFAALAGPDTKKPWWQVLGVSQGADAETIKAAWRRMASENHPDRGGNPARMAEINEAYRAATQ